MPRHVTSHKGQVSSQVTTSQVTEDKSQSSDKSHIVSLKSSHRGQGMLQVTRVKSQVKSQVNSSNAGTRPKF